VKPQWVRYKLEEAIEIPCSDLLASHQRKCEYVWSTWRNGDVSHLETDDEITTHGECVQPFAECKTIMTVMLTVMSGINHHKISQDSGWFGNGWFGSG
jgi:hypothetical protein